MNILDAKTKKLVEENPIAFATVDEKGMPNVICVAFVKVISPNQILMTDNYMKQTKRNLASSNNVCLAVWDKDWNGAKLTGTAEYFDKGEWKIYIERLPENKGLPAKGAILVTISKVKSLA